MMVAMETGRMFVSLLYLATSYIVIGEETAVADVGTEWCPPCAYVVCKRSLHICRDGVTVDPCGCCFVCAEKFNFPKGSYNFANAISDNAADSDRFVTPLQDVKPVKIEGEDRIRRKQDEYKSVDENVLKRRIETTLLEPGMFPTTHDVLPVKHSFRGSPNRPVWYMNRVNPATFGTAQKYRRLQGTTGIIWQHKKQTEPVGSYKKSYLSVMQDEMDTNKKCPHKSRTSIRYPERYFNARSIMNFRNKMFPNTKNYDYTDENELNKKINKRLTFAPMLGQRYPDNYFRIVRNIEDDKKMQRMTPSQPFVETGFVDSNVYERMDADTLQNKHISEDPISADGSSRMQRDESRYGIDNDDNRLLQHLPVNNYFSKLQEDLYHFLNTPLRSLIPLQPLRRYYNDVDENMDRDDGCDGLKGEISYMKPNSIVPLYEGEQIIYQFNERPNQYDLSEKYEFYLEPEAIYEHNIQPEVNEKYLTPQNVALPENTLQASGQINENLNNYKLNSKKKETLQSSHQILHPTNETKETDKLTPVQPDKQPESDETQNAVKKEFSTQHTPLQSSRNENLSLVEDRIMISPIRNIDTPNKERPISAGNNDSEKTEKSTIKDKEQDPETRLQQTTYTDKETKTQTENYVTKSETQFNSSENVKSNEEEFLNGTQEAKSVSEEKLTTANRTKRFVKRLTTSEGENIEINVEFRRRKRELLEKFNNFADEILKSVKPVNRLQQRLESDTDVTGRVSPKFPSLSREKQQYEIIIQNLANEFEKNKENIKTLLKSYVEEDDSETTAGNKYGGSHIISLKDEFHVPNKINVNTQSSGKVNRHQETKLQELVGRVVQTALNKYKIEVQKLQGGTFPSTLKNEKDEAKVEYSHTKPDLFLHKLSEAVKPKQSKTHSMSQNMRNYDNNQIYFKDGKWNINTDGLKDLKAILEDLPIEYKSNFNNKFYNLRKKTPPKNRKMQDEDFKTTVLSTENKNLNEEEFETKSSILEDMLTASRDVATFEARDSNSKKDHSNFIHSFHNPVAKKQKTSTGNFLDLGSIYSDFKKGYRNKENDKKNIHKTWDLKSWFNGIDDTFKNVNSNIQSNENRLKREETIAKISNDNTKNGENEPGHGSFVEYRNKLKAGSIKPSHSLLEQDMHEAIQHYPNKRSINIPSETKQRIKRKVNDKKSEPKTTEKSKDVELFIEF